LAYVRSGDRIRLSLAERSLSLLISDEELAERTRLEPKVRPTAARGYRKLFLDTITQADQGADFAFLRAEHFTDKVPKQRD
jgi:dihydroxy-acid dehydratase